MKIKLLIAALAAEYLLHSKALLHTPGLSHDVRLENRQNSKKGISFVLFLL